MYTIRDVVGPAIKKHVNATAYKEVVLRHWPKYEASPGVFVFSRLYLWTKDGGYPMSDSRERLYSKLGITVSDIESQDKEGLKSIYLDIDNIISTGEVTTEEVRDYITDFSPMVYPDSIDPFNPIADEEDTDLNPDPYKDSVDNKPLWDKDGWITSYLTYYPTNANLLNKDITDSQILAKCSGYNEKEITIDSIDSSRLTTLAMMDVDSSTFERKFTIKQRIITDKQVAFVGRGKSTTKSLGNFISAVRIEMKFRRIATPSSTLEDAVVLKATEVIATVNKLLTWADRAGKVYSMNVQLVNLANYVTTYVDDGSTLLVSEGTGAYVANNNEIAVRKDYLSSLKALDFVDQFSKRISSGYEEKDVEWWEVVIIAVLVIIIIIIAVLAAIPTGGGSIAWGAASIVLVIGGVVLTGLSLVFQANGSPAAAKMAGNAAEIIGYVAMVVGLGAIYQAGIQSFLEAELLSQLGTVGIVVNSVATVGGSTGVLDDDTVAVMQLIGSTLAVTSLFASAPANAKVPKSGTTLGPSVATSIELPKLPVTTLGQTTLGAPMVISNMSTGQILNRGIAYMNSLFNGYQSLIAPDVGEEFKTKQQIIEEQQKELDTLNPDQMEAVWKEYQDPYGGIFEVTEMIDRSYILLTSGRNIDLMNKCYNSGY